MSGFKCIYICQFCRHGRAVFPAYWMLKHEQICSVCGHLMLPVLIRTKEAHAYSFHGVHERSEMLHLPVLSTVSCFEADRTDNADLEWKERNGVLLMSNRSIQIFLNLLVFCYANLILLATQSLCVLCCYAWLNLTRDMKVYIPTHYCYQNRSDKCQANCE